MVGSTDVDVRGTSAQKEDDMALFRQFQHWMRSQQKGEGLPEEAKNPEQKPKPIDGDDSGKEERQEPVAQALDSDLGDSSSYLWDEQVLADCGFPSAVSDVGNEYPMKKDWRLSLLKGVPDVRGTRCLSAKDRLPEGAGYLDAGDRFWITSAAPTLHRQLLQCLSISTFMAQESSSYDCHKVGLAESEVYTMASYLSGLILDSIRSIVNFQRERTVRASGQRLPASKEEKERQIISDELQSKIVVEAERTAAFSVPQRSSAPPGKSSERRRPRFAQPGLLRQDGPKNGFSFDPSVSHERSRPAPYPHSRRGRGGRGRGRARGRGRF